MFRIQLIPLIRISFYEILSSYDKLWLNEKVRDNKQYSASLIAIN